MERKEKNIYMKGRNRGKEKCERFSEPSQNFLLSSLISFRLRSIDEVPSQQLLSPLSSSFFLSIFLSTCLQDWPLSHSLSCHFDAGSLDLYCTSFQEVYWTQHAFPERPRHPIFVAPLLSFPSIECSLPRAACKLIVVQNEGRF